LAKVGVRFDIDLIEGHYSAEVSPTVLFDPKGKRLRA
jgi:hypothetical protein